MDFTKFIAEKEQIEPALKAGLYVVMQSHQKPEYQYFVLNDSLIKNVTKV